MVSTLAEMNKIIQIIAVAVIGVLVGCQSRTTSRSASLEETAVLLSAAPFAATSITAATPAYGASLAIEGGNRSVQASSITLGMSDPAFARRVSRDELIAVARSHGWKFHEPWFYMGTRNHQHYFALYAFGGFRRIYAVPTDEWAIDDPFPLTANSSAWRESQMQWLGLQEIPVVFDEPMMPDLWTFEPDKPIRFLFPDRHPFTFFEQHGQQIDDGNAEKPPGVEREP